MSKHWWLVNNPQVSSRGQGSTVLTNDKNKKYKYKNKYNVLFLPHLPVTSSFGVNKVKFNIRGVAYLEVVDNKAIIRLLKIPMTASTIRY